jgi:hypothetical protein
MVVTGKVRDIYVVGETTVAQIYDADDRLISASFSKDGSDNISRTAHGAMITIRGEISSVDTMRLKLLKCDLDSVNPS